MNVFRKVIIYRPSEPVGLDQIKKGDLFKMLPADPEDTWVEPNALLMASTDPHLLTEPGRYEVSAVSLQPDADWPGIKDHRPVEGE